MVMSWESPQSQGKGSRIIEAIKKKSQGTQLWLTFSLPGTSQIKHYSHLWDHQDTLYSLSQQKLLDLRFSCDNKLIYLLAFSSHSFFLSTCHLAPVFYHHIEIATYLHLILLTTYFWKLFLTWCLRCATESQMYIFKPDCICDLQNPCYRTISI